MNGTVGVVFRDYTRMVLDPHQEFIQYWKSNTAKKPLILDTDKIPENEMAKVVVLYKFVSSLKNPKFYTLPEEPSDPNKVLHYVKYWSRTETGTLFRFEDRTIQINFRDHKKLFLFWNNKEIMVVDNVRERGECYNIRDLPKMFGVEDEKRRFLETKKMLKEMSI